MRLTNYDREAFVSSALDDVPSVDYDEQAQTLWKAFVRNTLPLDLLDCMKKYPAFFESTMVEMPGCLQNFHTILNDHKDTRNSWMSKHPDLGAQIKELAEAKKVQENQRARLESQLKGAIQNCNTLKQALELLPEFVKYLPEDRDGDKKCRQMPVVANLVTDLMAAGWPKGKVAPAPANK